MFDDFLMFWFCCLFDDPTWLVIIFERIRSTTNALSLILERRQTKTHKEHFWGKQRSKADVLLKHPEKNLTF